MSEALDEQTVNQPDAEDGEDDVHAEALARFDATVLPLQEERELNLQDRRFAVIEGAQWEGDGWDAMSENIIRVEFNETAQGAEDIEADYKEHRLLVNFRAVDKGATEETADFLDSLFRADFRRSKGVQVTDNAFSEAVLGGIGAFGLTTSYVDEYDPDDDRQQIDFRMITDADQSVFFDPDSVLPDKSDAKFAFEIFAMSPEAYKARYKDDPVNWPEGLTKAHYDWFTPDVVKVCRYYVVEERKERLIILRHSATDEERREWVKDLEKGALADLKVQGWEQDGERVIPRRRIRRYLMSGGKILGDKRGVIIPGKRIPIVMVYGKRRYIDGLERISGHVRKAKDPQRVHNTQISNLTEIAAMSPRERPIFAPEQVQGLEDSWANGDLERHAYALARPLRNEDGTIAMMGPIGAVTAPQLPQVAAALLQLTGDAVRRFTAADDGADEVKANVSAEAMDIAATRTDRRSFIYIDNMRQAFEWAGEIYKDMTAEVYVEDGREVDVVDEEGNQSTATLNEPFTNEQGAFGFRNNLQEGRYKVIADVSEATATRRDKTVKTCMNLSQMVGATDPELAGVLSALVFVNMDGEGISEGQDWARARLVRAGVLKPTDEEKQAMEQEAENQQPDPQAQAMQAQAQALQASAEKEQALAVKAGADTELAHAKTVQTLASAEKTRAETQDQKRYGLFDRVSAAAKGFRDPSGGDRPQNRQPPAAQGERNIP